MGFNLLYVIYAAVFIGALLFLEGLFYLLLDFRSRSNAAKNRRLRLLATGLSGEAALMRLRRRRAGEEGNLAALARNIPGYDELDRLLGRAGLQISVGRVLLMIAGITVALFVALFVLRKGADSTTVLLSVLVGVGAPLLIVMRMARYRLNKLNEQLPDAIDMIVRSLHAGHPVSAAFSLVAQEAKDPIGTEFGITYDEMTYGLDLTDALTNLSERVPLRELHFMVVSVRLQHSTGGNLAETLSVLSSVIRERRRMRDKIRALSAEGRASALVLTLLPFVVGTGMKLMAPDYYAAIPSDLVLTVAMGLSFLLLAIGIALMYRVVNFRV